jgi:uncharacterized membrane protein YdjX (TVP38/TMEM64 family)
VFLAPVPLGVKTRARIKAAARAPLAPFLIGTFLGLVPRTWLVVKAASDATRLDLTESGQITFYIVNIAIAIIVYGLVVYIAKRALHRVTR